MKVVLRTHVSVMLADEGCEPRGHINGKPYNWTWPLTVVKAKEGYFWFTGGWSNRGTKKGPFQNSVEAMNDAYNTLGGLR